MAMNYDSFMSSGRVGGDGRPRRVVPSRLRYQRKQTSVASRARCEHLAPELRRQSRQDWRLFRALSARGEVLWRLGRTEKVKKARADRAVPAFRRVRSCIRTSSNSPFVRSIQRVLSGPQEAWLQDLPHCTLILHASERVTGTTDGRITILCRRYSCALTPVLVQRPGWVVVQSSMRRPGARSNSRTLLVTRTRPMERAWPAII